MFHEIIKSAKDHEAAQFPFSVRSSIAPLTSSIIVLVKLNPRTTKIRPVFLFGMLAPNEGNGEGNKT